MDAISATRSIIYSSGLTQKAISEALGKSPRYLAPIISRGHVPSPDNLAKIAKICGWKLQLVKGDEIILIGEEGDEE